MRPESALNTYLAIAFPILFLCGCATRQPSKAASENYQDLAAKAAAGSVRRDGTSDPLTFREKLFAGTLNRPSSQWGTTANARFMALADSRSFAPPVPPDSQNQKRAEATRREWDTYFKRQLQADPEFAANVSSAISEVQSHLFLIGGLPDFSRDVPVPDLSTAGDFPDCVVVGDGSNFFCSGVIIGTNKVLTAAHCWCATNQITRVFCGPSVHGMAARTNPDSALGVTNWVVATIPYGHANAPDLIILVVSNTLPVSPKHFATDADLRGATKIRVAGFGSRDPIAASIGTVGDRFVVDLPIKNQYCKMSPNFSPSTQLCAVELDAGGNPLGLHDQCAGDSGGPGYVYANGEWRIACIVSQRFQIKSGTEVLVECGAGGIYTRLPPFLRWITDAAK